MENDEEMRSGNIFHLFGKFVFPAVIGVVIAGIQEIIDGFFIGNVIGSQGLAGITLAYPPYIVIVGIGVLIGIGASSLISLELGKGNIKEAQHIVHNTLPLCFLAGAVLTVGGLIFCETSLGLLEASGPALAFVREFLRIICMGSIFIVLSLALDPLVRINGKPSLCMNAMVLGVVANIVLDYIFVMCMGMGVTGSAIATVSSFALSALLLIYYLFGNRFGNRFENRSRNEAKLKIQLKSMELKTEYVLKILQAGLPSFVTQLSLALMLFVYNYMLLIYGSELAVSAYGIIGYICSIFYMLFEGIALGVQPIIGYNYGAGSYGRVSKILQLSIILCVFTGVFGFVLVYLFPESVVRIFSRNDSQLMEVTLRGMSILMLSWLVEGTVFLTVAYYQSINRVKAALFINLGKIFVLLLPLLFILPTFFGLDGVWSASPAAEYIMMAVVLGMLSKEFKFLKNGKKEANKSSRRLPISALKRLSLVLILKYMDSPNRKY